MIELKLSVMEDRAEIPQEIQHVTVFFHVFSQELCTSHFLSDGESYKNILHEFHFKVWQQESFTVPFTIKVIFGVCC